MSGPKVVAILGGQWGDEGKGKIIDYAGGCFSVVARATGGNNAGHTIYINGKKHVFHLIPSAMTWPDVDCILGNGMVIDLFVLLKEMKTLKEKGFSTDRLFISGGAHVIMPYHKMHDGYQEKEKGKGKELGTTKRGIGPAYADKKHRTGIRINDLFDRSIILEKLQYNVNEKLGMFTYLYRAEEEQVMKDILSAIPEDSIFDEYRERILGMGDAHDVRSISEALADIYVSIGKRIGNHVIDSSCALNDALVSGKSILLEGAQGLLLDIDHGTYPFVTSSNPSVGGLKTGLGISRIDETYSILKAYVTRVGSGPFPTELLGELGEKIREKGQEYGATTGRPRRCGWHDAVLTRHAAKINGKSVIITKLDVLTGIEKIKICDSYMYNGQKRLFNGELYFPGKIIRDFPNDSSVLEHCVPHDWIEVDGWSEDITMMKDLDELPNSCRDYLKLIEKLGNVEIALVSVGPERDQTIKVPGLWNMDDSHQAKTVAVVPEKKVFVEKRQQNRKYRAVIYDLDNTLLATDAYVRLLLKRTAELVARFIRFRVPSDAEIIEVQKKNLPFEEMFDLLFPTPDNYLGSEPLAKLILSKYREAAKNIGYSATPNGIATFKTLENKGVVQMIVTNRSNMAQERLKQAGYPENYFIFSPDSKEQRKPSPEAFKTALLTLESRGIRKEEILSVGDHTDDFLASKAAGLDFAAVLTGSTTKKDFEAAGLSKEKMLPDLELLSEIVS